MGLSEFFNVNEFTLPLFSTPGKTLSGTNVCTYDFYVTAQARKQCVNICIDFYSV